MRLRLVSWNIHSCVGTDKRYDPSRIASVLAGFDADIIGLQEVDWRAPQYEGTDQLSFLASRLGMNAIAGPNLIDHRGEFGNALLTRLQVEDVDHLDLSLPGREPRGCIDAKLVGEGRRIRVFVTHLGLMRRERVKQLRTIAQHLADGAIVDIRCLIGDINEWLPPLISGRDLIPKPFHAVCAPRTFPSKMPVFRLDRVYVAPLPSRLVQHPFVTGSARRASDHLPIVIDVEWDETADSHA